MITTKMYYWHDGILEETTVFIPGCSHLIVAIMDGIPVHSFIHLSKLP